MFEIIGVAVVSVVGIYFVLRAIGFLDVDVKLTINERE